MSTHTADNSLDSLLAGTPFLGYSYAYPHKTAYRPLAPKARLSDVWSDERRDSLFLYIHVPFCEFRCGFCNLFTVSQPEHSLPELYLAAMRRQADAIRESVEDAEFARLAIGGGTPTYLSTGELAELFAIATEGLGARSLKIPVSCEASPATLCGEKAMLLREFGVDRLSIGVQSFDDHDAASMGRPQKRDDVLAALQRIRDARFPTMNIDLIYGAETQSMADWLATVEEAVAWRAEELYLYPLYVRPLTGLGRLAHQWDDWRLTAYREARQLLLDRGYEQVSLRMFRIQDANSDGDSSPVYCCQDDGMVGLGCGARSYTRRLHYSREYGVATKTVRGILDGYLERSKEDFAWADYGIWLDDEEQRRRFAITSLLQAEGLSRQHYRDRFGGDPLDDLPELSELAPRGLATVRDERIRLTTAGLERSDVIGPWLYSARVKERMEAYQWD